MSNAEHISNRLSSVQRTLNEIAGEVRDSDLPYVIAEVENIARALVSLMEIQQTIYAHNPHLVPEYLEEKSPHREWNKEFGKLLIQNEYLLSQNNPIEAVTRAEEFVLLNPPKAFVDMANNEVERIKGLFGI